ncbi:tRNA selenocysteine 1-associated protein 1-like [Lineus longissimus]|uniref:tRNA selenocysteine 1-associated protein 1-like n=1 Tax=Lineus longissimus TaxID=88925 RepID=UPI002B4E1290
MHDSRMTSFGTLWMGDLEPYMDENFIIRAFSELGEMVTNVKLIRNRQTGFPQGYCFVEFKNNEAAQKAMLRLNGKVVPSTAPPKRFKLNHASYGKEHLLQPEYSLFIGDLSEDVDDYTLFNAFKRYPSCRTAKVVLDGSGRSKCYGFVRFSEEVDQHRALLEMQHETGIGKKPLRVSLATPKRPPFQGGKGGGGGGGQYDQYYNQYSQQYQNYQYPNYYTGNQAGQQQQQQMYGGYGDQSNAGGDMEAQDNGGQVFDDMEVLEDPDEEFDIDEENERYIEECEELFDALEDSRWTGVDNVLAQVESATS